MPKVDLTGQSLEDLDTLEKEIQAQRKKVAGEKRKKGLAAVHAAAKAHGFSLEELVGGKVKKERKPAVPKYRHPQQRDLLWSGRGRKPRWVQELLDSGKRLEDFTI